MDESKNKSILVQPCTNQRHLATGKQNPVICEVKKIPLNDFEETS